MQYNDNTFEVSLEDLWDNFSLSSGKERADIAIEIGARAYVSGENDLAVGLMEEALEIFRGEQKSTSRSEFSMIYERLANVYSELGRNAEALDFACAAAKIDEVEFPHLCSATYRLSSKYAFRVSDWERAIECDEKATLFQQDDNPSSLGSDRLNIAVAHFQLGRMKESIANLNLARGLFIRSQEAYWVSWVDEHLSRAYLEDTNGNLSEKHARRALDHANAIGDIQLQRRRTYNLGEVLFFNSKLEAAEEYFDLSRVLETSGDGTEINLLAVMRVDEALADLYLRTNRQEEAEEIYRRNESLEVMMGQHVPSGPSEIQWGDFSGWQQMTFSYGGENEQAIAA